MTQEWEVEPGVTSSMRRTVRVARDIGVIMIVYALALTTAIFIFDRGQDLLTFATVLVSTGAGLITGVSLAKAWQAQKE